MRAATAKTGRAHRGTRVAENPAPAPVDREALIRETAYFIYESNGRRPGSALSDWAAAEAMIDAMASVVPAEAPRPAKRRKST